MALIDRLAPQDPDIERIPVAPFYAAVLLYAEGELTLAQAAGMAGLILGEQTDFQVLATAATVSVKQILLLQARLFALGVRHRSANKPPGSVYLSGDEFAAEYGITPPGG